MLSKIKNMRTAIGFILSVELFYLRSTYHDFFRDFSPKLLSKRFLKENILSLHNSFFRGSRELFFKLAPCFFQSV